ncbi:hypothetical protein PPL_05774 [Heterostelium album PN500]|uniref:Uncharacterized protein n=1 Tax=Heterostelium pallidum (strain ATCC 26659 / Pp 5 / PN500) TaxID=670386 RepID=D3BB42_HETP5|nr:hypothetical protein PPL_05774 [Heterostelium album PN500]EFA81779.1 hypothetical protein PPL_05774 [Heterostelium album PN500]|eukprot:XP_020433896.1 hypothetical protein PPL_05774 [Heterostelium album PN500]
MQDDEYLNEVGGTLAKSKCPICNKSIEQFYLIIHTRDCIKRLSEVIDRVEKDETILRDLKGIKKNRKEREINQSSSSSSSSSSGSIHEDDDTGSEKGSRRNRNKEPRESKQPKETKEPRESRGRGRDSTNQMPSRFQQQRQMRLEHSQQQLQIMQQQTQYLQQQQLIANQFINQSTPVATSSSQHPASILGNHDDFIEDDYHSEEGDYIVNTYSIRRSEKTIEPPKPMKPMRPQDFHRPEFIFVPAVMLRIVGFATLPIIHFERKLSAYDEEGIGQPMKFGIKRLMELSLLSKQIYKLVRTYLMPDLRFRNLKDKDIEHLNSVKCPIKTFLTYELNTSFNNGATIPTTCNTIETLTLIYPTVFNSDVAHVIKILKSQPHLKKLRISIQFLIKPEIIETLKQYNPQVKRLSVLSYLETPLSDQDNIGIDILQRYLETNKIVSVKAYIAATAARLERMKNNIPNSKLIVNYTFSARLDVAFQGTVNRNTVIKSLDLKCNQLVNLAVPLSKLTASQINQVRFISTDQLRNYEYLKRFINVKVMHITYSPEPALKGLLTFISSRMPSVEYIYLVQYTRRKESMMFLDNWMVEHLDKSFQFQLERTHPIAKQYLFKRVYFK